MRLNGRVFEAAAARLERRPARDLYHAALEVQLPGGRFVVEQAPVRDGNGAARGVVAEAPSPVEPPAGGRAPGRRAGCVVAGRDQPVPVVRGPIAARRAA